MPGPDHKPPGCEALKLTGPAEEQISAGALLMVIAGVVLTVKLEAVDVADPQIPVTTTRYFRPFNVIEVFVNVRLDEVAPGMGVNEVPFVLSSH